MRFFHHGSGSRHRIPERLGRVLALMATAALISLGTIARADPAAGNNQPSGAAENTSASAVSGPSGPPSALAGSRGSRRGVSEHAQSYVGMTRRSERRQIESIDPASWLARFGDVEAVALR